MARHSVSSTDNFHLSVSMTTTTTLHFQMGKLKHSKVRTQGQCRGHLLISRLSAPLVDIMNCALSCNMSAPGQAHEGWPKAVLSSMCSYAEPAHSRHSPRSSGMNRCKSETHGWGLLVDGGQHSEAAPPAPWAHKQAGPPAVSHLAQWQSLGLGLQVLPHPVLPVVTVNCMQTTPRQLLKAQKGTGKETTLVPAPDKQSQVFKG